MPNIDAMAHETRLERRLDRLIARAVNPRKAAIVIASVTTAMTVVAGVLMTIRRTTTTSRRSAPGCGGRCRPSPRWATATTCRRRVVGRLLAAVVMLLGIGFVTVITASITGAFVTRSSRERADVGADVAEEQLRASTSGLDRIEAALRDLG